MGPAARGEMAPCERQESLIDRLSRDSRWIENYRIKPEEIESLSSLAMMGELKTEKDVLFILNQIRRAKLRW